MCNPTLRKGPSRQGLIPVRVFVSGGKVRAHTRTVYKKPGEDVPQEKAKKPEKKGETPEELLKSCNAVVEAHTAGFEGFKSKLAESAPAGADVQGRVKVPESILGKLTRKPDQYKKPSDLQDITGTRIVVSSIADVQATVVKLRSKYTVVEEDDYISKPQGDYRSHHLIVEDSDGLSKEIQVRTKNQDTFANWSHDVYKPLNPKQEAALESNRSEIVSFSSGMSAFFHAEDMGKKPPPPPKPVCPDAISSTFGCI